MNGHAYRQSAGETVGGSGQSRQDAWLAEGMAGIGHEMKFCLGPGAF